MTFVWLAAIAVGCSRANDPVLPQATPSAEQTREDPASELGETAPAHWPSEQPNRPDEPDDEAQREMTRVLALAPEHSTSVGSAVEGRLEGGVPLPSRGPGFRHNPLKNPERRYGTVELVAGVIRAAQHVHEQLPGGEVTINDISAKEGGDIPGHATHRSGRDIDVLFYLLDEQGQPRSGHAVPIEPDGTGVDYKDLARREDDVPVRIDVPRTWLFLAHLVQDPGVKLQHIYVVEHIRSMLLAHARAIAAPSWVIDRVAALTCQPKFPHDDHLHLRVFCTPQDIRLGCLDDRPIYPWQRNALAQAGVSAKIAGPRQGPPPKLTSIEAAQAAAGPMHADVLAFLERRKAWASKPKSKRRYCK